MFGLKRAAVRSLMTLSHRYEIVVTFCSGRFFLFFFLPKKSGDPSNTDGENREMRTGRTRVTSDLKRGYGIQFIKSKNHLVTDIVLFCFVFVIRYN